MDTDKDGLVNGYECKDVFLQTGLSQMILANIWSLCDVNSCGKLNSEQFALAMHFINKKLSTGLDAPLELTPEMIPPSLRPKPTMAEDSPYSRDLEELQLQVTELQREKLYYDQRASEHETVTRQKRTELSNLELEMESIFKTIKEREMKKSQEQKKLEEYEDKLVKYDTHLVDLQQKYLTEKEEIERLKMQIQHMDAAMKNKDHDLSKIKSDLQILVSEQASLEMRINSRRNVMLEVNNSFDLINIELIKVKIS
jgi:epidermal growth factor receptor substrate 15